MNQEKFLEEVIDRLDIGITVIDPEGRQNLVNKKFCEMTGFQKEELIGRKAPFKYWVEEGMSDITSGLNQTLQGVNKTWELLFKKKSGERFLARVSPVKLVDPAGQFFFIATVQDITASRKMEKELEESEQKYRTLLEESNDAIIIANAQTGFILETNTTAERLFGRSKAEIIGMHYTQLHPPNETEYHLRHFKNIRDTGNSDIESSIIRKDGSTVPISISARPTTLNGKKVIQGIFRDITERKHMEDKMRESEAELKAIYQSSPVIMMLIDSDRRVRKINNTAAEFADRSESKLIGLRGGDVLRCLHLHDSPDGCGFGEFCQQCVLRKTVLDTILTGTPHNQVDGSLPITGEAGTQEIHFLLSTTRLPITGSPQVLVTIIDITERKLAEKKIEHLASFPQLNPNPVIEIDENGLVSYSNAATRKLLKTLGIKDDERIFLPNDIKDIMEAAEQDKGSASLYREVELKNMIFSEHIAVLKKLRAARIYVHDVTDLKQADEALRESEEKYRAIVENSPNLVAIYQDGIYKYVNKAMCESLGWTFDELTSPSFNPIEKLLSPEHQAQAKENVAKRLNQENVTQNEYVLKTKSGGEIPIIVHAKRIPYKGKPALEYIFVDITEQKKAEDNRIKARSEVARSIAHDLRNPLQAIQAAADNLRNAPEARRPKILNLIDRNLEYSNRIVSNLMDFAALTPPKYEEGNVNSLLQKTLDQTIIPKNVKLTINYSNISAAMVDRDQLNRIFTNLILNAIQSMPDGGELTISTDQNNSSIEINITDTGAGISKENLTRIFTPFITTKSKGTGLGLYTAKKMVEAQGGLITVESEEGKGTTVKVLLPINHPRTKRTRRDE